LVKKLCLNCTTRYLGCHDECVHYKSYKEGIANINEKRRKKEDLERDIKATMFSNITRIQKIY